MHSIFYVRILHQKGITKMNLSSEKEEKNKIDDRKKKRMILTYKWTEPR